MAVTYWSRQNFDRLVPYLRIHKGRYFYVQLLSN